MSDFMTIDEYEQALEQSIKKDKKEPLKPPGVYLDEALVNSWQSTMRSRPYWREASVPPISEINGTWTLDFQRTTASYEPGIWSQREIQGTPITEEHLRSGFSVSSTGNRQTGRTIRMVLAAITEVSEGKNVVIVAPTRTIADNIWLKVSDLINMLGMRNFRNSVRCITQTQENNGYLRGRNGAIVYYDHTCE